MYIQILIKLYSYSLFFSVTIVWKGYNFSCYKRNNSKLEKKYAPALDNHGQSCFVRSDVLKMKCVSKTQMMPPPDHQNLVDMHTFIMCINIIQNIKAVVIKL